MFDCSERISGHIMERIKKLEKSQRYDVLDLWLRCMMQDNPFLEDNFWQVHYDKVKNDYLVGSDTYIYMMDGQIAGFICVTNQNYIRGLFVDPKFRQQGIGGKLIKYVKGLFSMLHVKIYMKNRTMVKFATQMSFVIDGAEMQRETGEIQYNFIWDENE